MKFIILSVVTGVILLIANYARSRRSKYYKWIAKNKASSKYQTMNLDTLIKVYKAIGSDNFEWNYRRSEDSINTLWYKREPKLPRVFFFWDYYLIDIPWFSHVLFCIWERRYSKQQESTRQEVARCRNATNDVLQDIQAKLEDQIQFNCQRMKDAAIKQEQVFSRLQNKAV